MNTLIIPLQPVSSQTLGVSLNGQSCTISIYQLTTGMFMDLSLNGAYVASCRLVVINQPLIRVNYNGFIGDFMMIDTQGEDQPDYSGLGSRWVLIYGY